MQLRFKKLSQDAVIPQRAREGDAGLDLVATSRTFNRRYVEYGTGLAVEIPYGHVGLIFPRSSISNYDVSLANSVGVIDAGYRGEIKFRMKVWGAVDSARLYQVGDKIGQLVILPILTPTPIEADELSDSERGVGGYGSTGI